MLEQASANARPHPLVYPFSDHPRPGELIRIADRLHWMRSTIPGPLKHVNCWLLDDDDGITIVDTGMDAPECRDDWTAILETSFAGVPVARVLGTHAHADHIGLAGWLCGRASASLLITRTEWFMARLQLAIERDEVPHDLLAFWKGAGWTAAQVADARAVHWGAYSRRMTPLPLRYDRLQDGERRTLGGRVWTVLVGSGHSPEHACLMDEARGILIAGDQILPRISPNISVSFTEPAGDPLGEWFASLKRLRRLPADLLVLPGHGDPFTGLHARVDDLRQEHEQRLDALQIHLATARTAVECFGVLFAREVSPPLFGMATGEAVAHLRRLEVEGRACREERGGVWFWYAT